MSVVSRRCTCLSLSLLIACSAQAGAQGVRPDTSGTRAHAPLATLQSEAERQLRIAAIRGDTSGGGFLLRSPSSRTRDLMLAPARGVGWAPTGLELAVTHNTSLPFSMNDGALWAGVGTSLRLTAGARLATGRLRIILAPTFTYSENSAFDFPRNSDVAPPIPAPRSPWSSPFHWQSRSIDLPRRFGDQALTSLDAGQSALYLSFDKVQVGLSNESQWWGPGVRNALLLSNAGPGFGHLFVRTARPLRTPLGDVEARYLLGMLTRSPFFEVAPASTEPARSLSAGAVTITPAAARGLTIGMARVVLESTRDDGDVLGSALNLFRNVGRPNARPFEDRTQELGVDQLFSVFGRWVLPDAGAELWSEWGRAEQPRSLRDFLVAPNHSQAFTVGLQVARPLTWRPGWTGALVLEHTQTTQSSTFQERPTGSWYTSRAVIQGFTQRGQPLGAAIGPGAQSEWLSFDAHSPTTAFGVYGGRIRWDDDAQYSIPRPEGNGLCKHDVSLFGGLRATRRLRSMLATADISAQRRLNAFYESSGFCFFNEQRVDRQTVQIGVTLHPAPH